MLDRFQISGNVPLSIQLLKMIDGGLKTDLQNNLIIQIEMPSCACALLKLSVEILEILKSPLLTGVRAYSIEFVRFRKRTPKFLKGVLKLTENFQKVISNGVP